MVKIAQSGHPAWYHHTECFSDSGGMLYLERGYAECYNVECQYTGYPYAE
jgi:hypothetical protein